MYQRLQLDLKSREFRIIDLLIDSLKIFKEIFLPLLILNLLLLFPVECISEIFTPTFGVVESYEYSSLSIFLPLFFQIPGLNSITILTNQYLIEGKFDVFKSASKGFSKWSAFTGTATISGVIGFFLILLFIVPGLIFFVRIFFIHEAVLLRNLSGESAISYSRSMVAGRWWKVFFIIFILFMNYILFSIISNLFISIFVDFFSDISGVYYIAGVLHRSLNNLMLAYGYVISTLFFINLEFRKV